MISTSAISIERLRVLDLVDNRGHPVNLGDAVAGAPAVIVFIRGHWCPYCRRYLCKLQQQLKSFREIGARLFVISPEPPATSAGMLAQLRLTITIISDASGRAIDVFGVRNRFSAARTLLPHPAVVVVDASGNAVFRSVDRNYKSRTSMRTILKALRAAANP